MKKYAIVSLAALAVSAVAGPVTPTYGTFGNLGVATWGGSDIPTDPAAITTFGAASTAPQVTLGLIAHQRFSNPALGNNGLGTYFAMPGIDTNAPSPADPYATWNVGFYIGGAGIAGFTYALLYDFDPLAATEESAHGRVTFGALTSTTQNSWNMGMNFLDSDVPGVIAQPTFASFDPTANGQYTFALVAYNQAGAEVGRSAIAVNVGAVPEPGSLALVGLALAGAAVVARRRAA